jgi:hypothetical protein
VQISLWQLWFSEKKKEKKNNNNQSRSYLNHLVKFCAKQNIYITFPERNHLPQTWKSVYVVKFDAAEESEFDPNSGNIFLGI